MNFPRSTYYKALISVPSKRELEANELKKEIKKIWLDSKSRYGAPKIRMILSKQGKNVSIKRVQRYMTELQIRSIVVKKFRYHSEKVTSEAKENILKRDFTTTTINQKWCTDITYIYTIKNGWTYLASVMDLHSKKIIGYAYDLSMSTDLVIKSVENACLNVKNTH